MTSDNEYDDFLSDLPPDSFLEEALRSPNLPRQPSRSPAVSPQASKRKHKKSRKKESDQDVLERMQPLAAKTKTHAASYHNLGKIQVAATEDSERTKKYSPSGIRATMKINTQQHCDGKTPRWYQEDSADAFMLGMDVVLVSGTGSGKTLAFLQSLLADETGQSKLVIISPLNELEYDMAQRCNKMGLTALAVNGDMWAKDTSLEQKLLKHQFRVILTSPEMIFQHPTFSTMMRNANWTKNIIGTVIDEAHCVLEWKDKFRTAFGMFNKARAYLPGKPIFAASATLTPSMIDSLTDTLSFNHENSFILNVGNDRPNITTIVCRMVGGESDYEALDFLLDEAREGKPLIRTMVFFNTRNCARLACQYIKRKLAVDSPYRSQIFAIWATKSAIAKRKIMDRFSTGKIIILFATEVAGMGMDLGDIRRVVQYMIPQRLTQWTQHAGRCGRDGKPATAILLVEPSVFQKVRKKKVTYDARQVKKGSKKEKPSSVDAQQKTITVKEEEQAQSNTTVDDSEGERSGSSDEEGGGWTKGSLGPALYSRDEEDPIDEDWDENERTHDCRFWEEEDIEVVPVPAVIGDQEDREEDSQALEEENDEMGYRKNVEGRMRELAEAESCRREVTDAYYQNPPTDKGAITLCCDNCIRDKGENKESALSDEETSLLVLSARLTQRPPPPPTPSYSTTKKGRSRERLKNMVEDLKSWRFDLWRSRFPYVSFPPEALLSDRLLTMLAKNASVKTMDDLAIALPKWGWREKFGPLLLTRIQETDEAWQARQEQESELKKREKQEKQEEERAQREAIRQAEHLAIYGVRDPPGTILAANFASVVVTKKVKKETKQVEELQVIFRREDGTEQPGANELVPDTSDLTHCDARYYSEAALVKSLADTTTKEIVTLDCSSSQPLTKCPIPTAEEGVQESLARLIKDRKPPVVARPRPKPRPRAPPTDNQPMKLVFQQPVVAPILQHENNVQGTSSTNGIANFQDAQATQANVEPHPTYKKIKFV